MPSPRLPPLGTLRAFEAAARKGSFKEAAEELAVPPAAVSQQIRTLEADLGLELFARGARSVTLTERGAVLFQGVSKSFSLLRDSLEEVRPKQSGLLRISCEPPVATKWLAPRLHKFTTLYPMISVCIDSTFALSDSDRQNQAWDVAILFGAPPSTEFYFQEICTEAVVPMASPRLVERLELKEPEDLARAPLLHDASMLTLGAVPTWQDWFSAAGMPTADANRGTRFARYADQALDAAISEAGVVLGRRFLAAWDVAQERLKVPFGPMLQTNLSYYLVCPRGTEDHDPMRPFMEWALKEFAEAPPLKL